MHGVSGCVPDGSVSPGVYARRLAVHSYLTIELREAMPAELRSGVGDWLFGCDVCQEVCPWNRFAPPSAESQFEPLESMNPVALAELFDLTEEDFRRRFRHTPLWRPH